jgi:amino acid adenylation domain-containing protein
LNKKNQKIHLKEDFDTMRSEMEYILAEDYWLKKLELVKVRPIFGDKMNVDNSPLNTFRQWRLPLSTQLEGSLQEVTGGSAVKAFLVFITALSILMYKYIETNDILISTADFESEDCTDYTDVLLFFRSMVNEDSIPRDLLNMALDELNMASRYHQFDYKSFFKRFCANNNGDPGALSALGFIYNNFNRDSRLAEEIELLFRIEQHNDRFVLCIRYNKDSYNLDQVKQLGQHFVNIMGVMLADLDKPVKHIDILTAEDLRKLLRDFNGESIDYRPGEKTFVPSFERQVEKTSNSTAAICDEKVLNYRELNETVNQLARCLLKEVSSLREDLVGILMERSEKLIESIIAVWKCGAAYIPLDPDSPDDRIKRIIKDSRPKLVICKPGLLHQKMENELNSITRIIYLDKLEETRSNQDKTNPGITVFPNSLAYVIYTSGSTGTPKGVMVEHRGMMNHMHAKLAEIQIDTTSVIVQNASQCFDISIWQFFAALLKGGQTIVYTDRLVLSPEGFIKQVGKNGITILEVVPSYLSMMLDIIDERKMEHLFPALKYLLVTGETVRPALVKRWFEKFPGIKMVNAYGPTEASDDVTHFIMEDFPGDRREIIPIGRTVRNFRIYITDDQGRLCPIGVKGEIYVSGIGVGRGYLNDIYKTRKAFMKDPFRDEPGVMMYRTGDIGRYSPDGNIEFFGRKDYQVKIRGYRIELEEIENKLSSIVGIRAAVVVDREDKTHNKYLCAYITLMEGIQKDAEGIKRALRSGLPEYMIPSKIVVLKDLPLTPNRKIDRKALPEPDEADISSLKYVAARSEVEKKLVEIWQEILGVGKIGIHDNFFNLGGDSFKGIRIINKIQDWLHEVVHVTVLFLAPTIAELALKLESYKKMDSESRVDAAKIAGIRSLIKPLNPLPSHLKSSAKTPPVMFILCPSRSGSTLLRVILAGHPKLFAPQEFELLSYNTLQERKEALSGAFSLYLEGVIRAIMEIKQIDADDAKAIMEEFEKQGMTVQKFYEIFQGWLEGRMLVEKTPQYTYDLEVLKRAEEYFDSPLYIHLIRHPYAVIYSYENARLDQLFKYEHRFSTRQLGELLWLTCHQNILEFLENIPGNRKYQLKYEDLVSEPEHFVSQMCDHFGLKFYSTMLNIYGDADKRMTDGIHAESKMLGDVKFFSHKSIDTRSVEKWKEKYQTEFLGDAATHLAKSFGYLQERIEYSGIEVAPQKDYYELSHAQKRLWILNQLEGNQIAYNISHAYQVEGDLNIDILKKSFETVVMRHESLRTTFIKVDGNPMQKIHDFESLGFKLEYMDLRNQENPGKKAKISAVEEAAMVFDLEKGPLLRGKMLQLEEKKYVFLFTLHHIISDGWSMRLLVNEVLTLYEAYKGNKEKSLAPLRFQYKDYSEWQNSKKMRKALKKQESYWLKLFEGEIPVLSIPTDYSRPSSQSFEGSVAGFDLSVEETKALNKIAVSEGASLFMILLAIFDIFLSKISSQEDIVVGTPTAGRNHPDLEHIIGMFVNTLSLRNYPSGEKPFIEFLRQVKRKTLEAFENQDYPFEDLVEKIKVMRDMSRNPLFEVMFLIQNIDEAPASGEIGETKFGELNILPLAYERSISKFDLSLSTLEAEDRLYFAFQYCTKLFEERTIYRFINYFKRIITAAIETPGKPISEIEILSEKERKEILIDFNHTKTLYPKDKTVHQLFEEQTEQAPDHIAVIMDQPGNKAHRGNGHHAVTYKELNQRAGHLAIILREKGIKPGCIAGIMMERSIQSIAAMLAILKSGGAYLPLDRKSPGERVKYMLADSNVQVLVVEDNLRASWLSFAPNALLNLSEGHHLDFPASQLPSFPASLPSSLAYVMYTSGSTGKPKGVMIEHGNVVRLVKNTNFIHWVQGDRLLPTGGLAFDISTFEIWGALLNGAALFLAEDDAILDAEKLKKMIDENKISILHLIPQLFNQLLFQSFEIFTGLKYFLIGGDLVKPSQVNELTIRSFHLEILHMYGPTENTTFSTYFPVTEFYKTTIPIGKPIANSTVYIVDKYNKLTPVSVPGELVVGGDGVARGYLNRPELTAEKFCLWQPGDSFRENRPLDPCKSFPLNHSPLTTHHSPIYKTGDLAKWLPDGNLEFLGRIDSQVKIRGQRIEIGEIENQLLKHENIKEAIVLAKEHYGDKFLCAYILPHKKFDLQVLRGYLSHSLPDHMVPTYFVQIEEIPLTATGKIDRKALPDPEVGAGQAYVKPENTWEEKLCDIWSEILGIGKEKIGTGHNFFEIGGNSLNLIMLVGKINKEFGIAMPIPQIYRYPTIKDIARSVLSKNFSDQPVVLLNRPKPKKMFGFPDQIGFGYGYGSLASLLEDRSLYALSFIEEEDRLSRYIDIITGIQPVGPYVFFGHSAAGRLSFEVARALENQGYEVSDIIFMDCFFTENMVRDVEEESIRFRPLVETFLKEWKADFLKEKVMEKAIKHMKYLNTVTKLEKINANIHLIISEQAQQNKHSDPRCWEKSTTKTSRVYNGWGRHVEMLGGSALEKNIKIIREILDGITFGKE